MSTEIKDWNGLPAVFVENKFAKAVVALHGAHVVSYEPNGEREVLWVSAKSNFQEGKPIRGGIPVCWPWFGPVAQPAHGVARISPWMPTVKHDLPTGETVLNFAFVPPKAELAFLLANMTITIGKSLKLELETSSNADEDYILSEALHSYFAISDISGVSVGGMDQVEYLDSLTGETGVQQGDIRFDCETDRIYKTQCEAWVEDPCFHRRIHIRKSGSNSTVVWNPWIEKSKRMADFGDEEYHGMVCVETANAKEGSVLLKPGASHKITTEIFTENIHSF